QHGSGDALTGEAAARKRKYPESVAGGFGVVQGRSVGNGSRVQRFALRGRPGFAIANSSSLCPLLRSARSQRGVAPRPAQVSERFFGLRYFGGTLRPLSLLPRGFGPRFAPRPVTPRTSIAASLSSSSRRAATALVEMSRTTLSRSATKSSNDMDLSFKP